MKIMSFHRDDDGAMVPPCINTSLLGIGICLWVQTIKKLHCPIEKANGGDRRGAVEIQPTNDAAHKATWTPQK